MRRELAAIVLSLGLSAWTARAEQTNKTGFVLRSPAVADDGALPKEFTGDGAGATRPLEWRGAPAGTKSYALIMHHIDPKGIAKWYWTLYSIPADVESLPRNVKAVGTLGNNSVNERTEYAPPHSKGPGAKKYILTLYALSAAPKLSVPAEQVSRAVLLDAMKDLIVATAELQVVYTRQGVGGGPGEEPRQPPPRGDRKPKGEEGPQGDQGPRGNAAAMPENRLPASPNPGQTVGLFRNDPRAFRGYTLFAPKHNTVIYLIDNEGRIVHSWRSRYEPGQTVYLLENGHLLHCFGRWKRDFTQKPQRPRRGEAKRGSSAK